MKRLISIHMLLTTVFSIVLLCSCEQQLLNPNFEADDTVYVQTDAEYESDYSEYETYVQYDDGAERSTPDSDNASNFTGKLYATPKGKKYHFLPNCGGKNSVEITVEEAEERGLEPCKNCAY